MTDETQTQETPAEGGAAAEELVQAPAEAPIRTPEEQAEWEAFANANRIPAEAPPEKSSKEVWEAQQQAAVVQGPNLSQIVWRGPGLDNAMKHLIKYGDGKGWAIRAAFLNPLKKTHVILGPLIPLNAENIPQVGEVSDEEWAKVDLSPFATSRALSLAPGAAAAARQPREPKAPREPRAPRAPRPPGEPRLSGVAPLAMIPENPGLYPFLRMGENKLYFVANPERTRSIRWDAKVDDAFLADFKEKSGLDIPVAELLKQHNEATAAGNDPTIVVKTRFSRYDIKVTPDEAGEAITGFSVQKYKSDTAVPAPDMSPEARAARELKRQSTESAMKRAAAEAAAAGQTLPSVEEPAAVGSGTAEQGPLEIPDSAIV